LEGVIFKPPQKLPAVETLEEVRASSGANCSEQHPSSQQKDDIRLKHDKATIQRGPAMCRCDVVVQQIKSRVRTRHSTFGDREQHVPIAPSSKCTHLSHDLCSPAQHLKPHITIELGITGDIMHHPLEDQKRIGKAGNISNHILVRNLTVVVKSEVIQDPLDEESVHHMVDAMDLDTDGDITASEEDTGQSAKQLPQPLQLKKRVHIEDFHLHGDGVLGPESFRRLSAAQSPDPGSGGGGGGSVLGPESFRRLSAAQSPDPGSERGVERSGEAIYFRMGRTPTVLQPKKGETGGPKTVDHLAQEEAQQKELGPKQRAQNWSPCR